ncbi:hypothetical protein [Thermosynechococcus sp.]|uniref:type IV pilus modification PilV family protein n=1 Tax=Thermosynechococcus sp. TaxID=2814275 RepID=UPI00391C16E4
MNSINTWLQLRSRQKGLTLFECLVAILVVNLGIAMLTMPLAIVAATRLRNDRINKAGELARESLDRLQAMMEQGIDVRTSDTSLLPPEATVPNDLSREPHPTSVVNCAPPNPWFTDDPRKACLRRVGSHEFGVQIVRGPLQIVRGPLQVNSQVNSYLVQVRVYEKRAIKSGASSTPTGPIQEQPVLFTAASDQIEAPNQEDPLVVLSTCILRARSPETLDPESICAPRRRT